MQPAVADKKLDDSIYVGEDTLSKKRAVYEFQWHHSWNRVSHTKNGTTGWATILQSTNPSNPAKNICRIHVCANDPCTAVWEPTKYGDGKPAPYHVRLKQLTFAAVAESLVAQTSSSSAAPPDVVQIPVPEEGPKSSSEVMPQVGAPPAPTSCALKGLLPAAPTSPIHLPEETEEDKTEEYKTAVAGGADEGTDAFCRVRSRLLSLARDIRRPGQYVGYSAFVLMALVMKCRPIVWEGSSSIDLLETFAPWAKED